MLEKTEQVIRANEVYSVAEFRLKAGIGDSLWRKVRKRITVIEMGRKRYILGRTWIKYLEKLEEEQTK